MSLTQAASRGAAATVGGQLVRLVLQFAAIVILARILLPEDYALVAMVMAVIGVADILRDGGLSTAAVQAESLSDDERTNLFWTNVLLGGLCTLLAIGVTPLVVALYDEPRLGAVVPALAGIFLLSGVNTQFRVALSRELRFGALAAADVVSQAMGVVVAVLLARAGAGYWALVAQLLVAAALVLVVNAVNARWWPGLPRRHVSVRRFFGFGARVVGSQVLSHATTSVDVIALGAVHGATSVGFYNRAAQIVVTPLSQINVPLSRVAIPVLARAQHDDLRFVRAAGHAQLVGSYVTPTVLAVVAGLAAPLTEVLLGARWAPVAPILAVLAIAGMFRSVAHLSYWLFLARGAPGAQLRLDVWAKPVMLVMIVSGAPFGATGVAAASAVAWAFYWVVGLTVAGRAVGVPVRPLFRRAVLAFVCLGAPAGVSAWLVSGAAGGGVLGLGAGLGAAVLGGLLVSLVVPSVRRDLAVLTHLGRQALRRRR